MWPGLISDIPVLCVYGMQAVGGCVSSTMEI